MKDGFVKVAAGTPAIRVADPQFNARAIIALMEEAAAQGVKLLCLPELCLTGYTCADLFLQPALLRGAEAALGTVLAATRELDLLAAVGLPVACDNKLYNCAAVIQRGSILGLVPKTCIPNYGEFYEGRWFASGQGVRAAVELCGQRPTLSAGATFACGGMPELVVGVEICEDLWAAEPPSAALCRQGATVVLNLSASDEVIGKSDYRRALVTGQSARCLCAYVYADAGEGESTTDLVFCGHDLIAENGSLLGEDRFHTGLTISEIDVARLTHERRRMNTWTSLPPVEPPQTFSLALEETALTRRVDRSPFVPENADQRAQRCQEILTIAALGLKKRLDHAGAKTAVVGLSGGLDSTLAALITARALDLLGRPRRDMVAVTMPCFGTTDRTRDNACLLADRLGADLRTVDIGKAVRQHFADIGQSFENHDVTFENAQARERTQVLMDVCNQTGGLVVGTGDLSELALGWCTYNGDQMSMYAVNASIPKTLVRYVVDYVAQTCGDAALAAVLRDILATPVSPELLPAVDGQISQKTEDLVGPYELHDFFLYYALRWAFPPKKVYRLARCAFRGDYDDATVLKWLKTFYRRFFTQQFKRSAAPDGPKVGAVALSPRGDWRMPSDASSQIWLEDLEGL